jgi:hypothetical protein
VSRWTIVAEVDDTRALIGGWQAGDIARSVGAWPLWLGSKRRWSLELIHVRDFIAVAEERGAAVIVTGDLPPIPAAAAPVVQPDMQLCLFGGGDAA